MKQLHFDTLLEEIRSLSVPTARVVRWPHAQHNMVKFHKADVIKEMNAFLSSLK